MNSSIQKEQENSRFVSIDAFRGFLIPIMTFVNTTSCFTSTPLWLQHVNGIGLTITDLVAPFFLFAIALTYRMVYYKNSELNHLQRILRTLRRYLAFLGMGMLSSLSFLGGVPTFSWGTLAYIGLSGCLVSFIITFSWKIRLVIAAILTVGYQILIEIVIGDIILAQMEGGLYGVISWTSILVLGTVLADLIPREKFLGYLYFGLTLIALGVGLHFLFNYYGLIGISRLWISTTYVYVSVGLASCIFAGFWYLYEILKFKYSLEFLGKNPLFLFIIQGVLTMLCVPIFPETLHLAWVILIAICNVLIVGFIGWIMDRKGVYIRF